MSGEVTRSKAQGASARGLNHAAARGGAAPQKLAPGSAAELRRCVGGVAFEAEALEGRLRELKSLNESAALWRLVFGLMLLVVVGIAGYLALPPALLAVGLPLVAGGLIMLMRLDHVVGWMHRLFVVSARRAASTPQNPGRWQRFVVKPFLAGLNLIGARTANIEDRYLRAGVGSAATLYYGGGAAAAAAAAVAAGLFMAYIAISLLIAVVVIGVIIAVLAAILGGK